MIEFSTEELKIIFNDCRDALENAYIGSCRSGSKPLFLTTLPVSFDMVPQEVRFRQLILGRILQHVSIELLEV